MMIQSDELHHFSGGWLNHQLENLGPSEYPQFHGMVPGGSRLAALWRQWQTTTRPCQGVKILLFYGEVDGFYWVFMGVNGFSMDSTGFLWVSII